MFGNIFELERNWWNPVSHFGLIMSVRSYCRSRYLFWYTKMFL